MTRALLILNSDYDRRRAKDWIDSAPPQTRVEFKAKRRNSDQNALMWANLTEIASQVEWYGQKLSAEDWKDIFTASLRRARVVPGIDAGTFVPLGMRTSDLSKEEFSDLIELMNAFAAERGVVFRTDMMGHNGSQEPQDEQETPETGNPPSETETRLHESAPDEQPSGEVFNPPSPVEGDGPLHPHSKPGSSSSPNSEAHSSSLDASDAGAGTPPLPAPAPLQECAIKIMGIAIDPMFETKEQRRYALAAVKDDWKKVLPESDWPVLKDLVTSSYDCVKGEADYAAAVQHFAQDLKIPLNAFAEEKQT